jgi:hypothetical protein
MTELKRLDLMELAKNNREKLLSIVDRSIETFEKTTKNTSNKKLLGIKIDAVGVHLTVDEEEEENDCRGNCCKYEYFKIENQPENSEIETAREWLIELLKDGAKPIGSVNPQPGSIRYEAKKAGFKWETIRLEMESETKEEISAIAFAKNLNEAQIFLSAIKNTKADINHSNVRDVSNFYIAIREGIEWGMCIAKCQTEPETPATEPETDPKEQITPFGKIVDEIQTFLTDSHNQIFASWFENENETKIEITKVAEEIQEGIYHLVGYDRADEKHCLGGAVITVTIKTKPCLVVCV